MEKIGIERGRLENVKSLLRIFASAQLQLMRSRAQYQAPFTKVRPSFTFLDNTLSHVHNLLYL